MKCNCCSQPHPCGEGLTSSLQLMGLCQDGPSHVSVANTAPLKSCAGVGPLGWSLKCKRQKKILLCWWDEDSRPGSCYLAQANPWASSWQPTIDANVVCVYGHLCWKRGLCSAIHNLWRKLKTWSALFKFLDPTPQSDTLHLLNAILALHLRMDWWVDVFACARMQGADWKQKPYCLRCSAPDDSA